MNLFEMSDAELDRAVQSYYDHMLDKYLDEQERMAEYCVCRNCTNYNNDGTCHIKVKNTPDEELERMEAEDNWESVSVDEEDYCDDFDPLEADDEPPYDEDERGFYDG